MNKFISLALVLPVSACVIGTGTTLDDSTGSAGSAGSGKTGTGTGPGTGTGTGTPVGAPGGPLQLTADTTWSGTINLLAPVVLVHPGVTLTISAGTTVQFQAGAVIQAIGTVDVRGAKGTMVHLGPAKAGDHFAGIEVPQGGTLTMTYGHQHGGGITVNGGTVTISDSMLSQSGADYLTVNAGKVDVSYSDIGLDATMGKDDSHCQMHFGGSAATVAIRHSNITSAAYGLMLYGGSGADLTFNNWYSNGTHIDTVPGVTADISNGWFDTGAPKAGAGATLTYTSPAAARLTDAGPR